MPRSANLELWTGFYNLTNLGIWFFNWIQGNRVKENPLYALLVTLFFTPDG